MKSIQWQKIFSSFFILIFLTACGKDQNSGSSSSSLSQQSNPITQTNITVQGQTALNNAKNWYNSSYEPKTMLGYVTETRIIQSLKNPFSGSNCDTNNLKGKWLTYSVCDGLPTDTQNLDVKAQTKDKSVNSKLKDAFVTTNRQLQLAKQSPSRFGGVVFELVYKKTNGYFLIYVIDTSFHSAFNPVMILDYENDRFELLKNLAPNR
jgi:hypothetical protein